MEISKIKCYSTLLCIALFSFGFSQVSDKEVQDPYAWELLSESSPTRAMKGAFIGKIDEYIVLAGGSTPNGTLSDAIYALDTNSGNWEKLKIKLPKPMAFGATAVLDDFIFFIGGSTQSSVVSDVYRLTLDTTKNWTLKSSKPLPTPLHLQQTCILENRIYVGGGYTDLENKVLGKFYEYFPEKDSWKTLASVPRSLGKNPSLVVQNEGNFDAIFAYSETDNTFQRFNPSNGIWTSLLPAPLRLGNAIGFPVGSAHIMYLSTSELSSNQEKEKYAAIYHTITDRWVNIQNTEIQPIRNGLVPASEAIVVATSENNELQLYTGTSTIDSTGLSLLDIFTFCVYFIVLLYMGYRFSKRIKNTDDYFRGGKRIPAWAAGISIVATKLSAVTFMSIPAKVFATDWLYFLIPFNSIVLAFFVVKVVLPFFQRMNLTSAYEYLEVRFNVVIRILGSVSYLLWEIGRVGVLLLLPAIVISVVADIDLYFCILLIGFIATIYTLIGGIEAVIWTDVIQVIVMMVGILIALFIMVDRTEGSLMAMYESAHTQGKLKAFDWDLDLTKATVLVIVLGWVGRIQEYVSTQSIVQRFMTTKNEKAAAKSMWISALVSIPVVIIFYFVGTALFLYYQQFPQDLNPTMEQTDAILPTFFITQLPVGVIGLVIAAIFAAAMSSLDSAMNSMSTVIITDFYKRFKPKIPESRLFKIAKYLVGILGVLGTASAVLMASFEIKSLFDQLLLFMGLTGGGLAGVFLLGMLTKRASSRGVFVGFVSSCILQYYISFHTDLHFLLYATTGLVSCFIIGYVASFILPYSNYKKRETTY
ncbi:sodium:solute symporter family transporter [Spongiimicrobium sp. 3-5]|uniref:sodium:solute symporter family transporter n=1 Tax=Spongiimicrobium sp. 3-5 TaxID=3332596 RepID=UPI00397F09B6